MLRAGMVAMAIAIVACSAHRDDPPAPAPTATPRDAAPDASLDAQTGWPELAEFPHVDPVRVIALPAKTDQPRFNVGGPVLAGELAIVSSSQFGFAAVDYHRGTIAWTKPGGLGVAPPLVTADGIVLVDDCARPTPAPPTDELLGCLRIVTPAGADVAYVAIHGAARDVSAFASATGAQALYASGDHRVRWRRGDAAVAIDLLTGAAIAAPADPPPIVVTYKDRTWDITSEPGGIVARQAGAIAWHTRRHYSALLGSVWLPGQSPMIRAVNLGGYGGHPELNLFDIDATGSLHGQVAFPVPGIEILGSTISSIGDTAIAVRLDRSLQRDFIVGYAANSLLMWIYALPELPRADPVGLATAPDAIVVFHDGDTLTILPELSAPATAPGAARAPLQNPTP